MYVVKTYIERWSYCHGDATAMVIFHGFPQSSDAMFETIFFKSIDINNVDHNYVQARRVCYFLWLLAALLSAPTLVARVYLEVFKRQRRTLIQRRTLRQRHISFLLIIGDGENLYKN